MANEAVKSEKKITIEDLDAAVLAFPNGVELTAAIKAGLVDAKLDTVDIDGGKFSGDYVRLSLGKAVVDDATALEALKAIAGGVVFIPAEKQDDGTFKESRKPSLVKHALYGADLAMRGKTAAAVRTASAGPEKQIENMVKSFMKSREAVGKPVTEAQAREMVAVMMAD